MYLQLDPYHPELWKLAEIARLISNGALGVVPTDTTYAFVCDCRSKKAVQRLYQIKNLSPNRPLSIICPDLRSLADNTRSVPTSAYRILKRCLPGPYTFIVKAGGSLPRLMTLKQKRKTVGIRIPDDPICQAIMQELDFPLLCSSVKTEDDSIWNSPAEIYEKYGKRIDFVVDGGERLVEPSTVIDFSEGTPEIIRVGKGDPSFFE
jgi:tRNA threonylcarbamoyl adenosine modification protein (Sua5/YciO/YrdC/YwlC family)